MRTHFVSSITAAILIVTPTALCAQSDARPSSAPSGRGSVGVHFQVAEPKGDFAANINAGFGVGAYVLGALDRDKIFNVRADLSFLSYANSNRRIPLAGTGGLIQLDLRTSSNIATVVVGPQLLGPTGVFTPYATALGGFSVFWTQSSVEGSQNQDAFATSTNASDAAWAYGGAVGSYIRLSNGSHPVRLDLGARVLRHDDVRYLTADRVKEAFENNRPPVAVRGRADFITYYVGVNIIAF